jgi:2-oxo-4-hydroxy-4-carboxy--5-ureidoimidazoline (OHCU) decarboxylase
LAKGSVLDVFAFPFFFFLGNRFERASVSSAKDQRLENQKEEESETANQKTARSLKGQKGERKLK